MKKLNKHLSVLLALLMIVSIIPMSSITAFAAYENTYTNTGNQRVDIIGVAKTQIGYVEGSGNDTKYGDWYGLPNNAWCGMFVSWCANQADIPTSVLKKTARAHPDSFGIPCYSGTSYTPQSGDLFFVYGEDGYSHVGLVYYTEGNYFYTIEGNWSNKVLSRKLKISDYYFGVPSYSDTSTKEYEISYNYNYTENGIGYDVMRIDETTGKYTVNCSPTRTGYALLGWSKSSTATSPTYYNGQTYTFTSNTTLYAVWRANTYTVTYNANGGSGAPASQTKTYGTTLTLSSTVPTRTGYTFLGWSTSSTATSATYSAGGSFTTNANTTLYAVWKSATTIFVNTQYSADVSFPNKEVYYVFTPSLTDEYIFESTGSLDSRVYVYDAAGTSIGYNDDGGEGTNFKLSCDLTAGTAYYVKVRAYKNYTGTINFKVMRTCTITYDGNGGTNSRGWEDWSYGEYGTITIDDTIPTREGYTFLGWSTSSTATSATYQPGDSITMDSDVTLYAVWRANTYTVTYNANGGSGAPASQTKTHGTTLMLSSTVPTRTGYTFLGWSTSSTATSATYQPGGSFTTNANTTLYAVWQENSTTPSEPSNPDTDFTISIQEPSRTTIRYKDGIVLHAVVEGELPEGATIEWASDNNNFEGGYSEDGMDCVIVSKSNGTSIIFVLVCDENGEVLALDAIEMNSKAGFFQKIASWFRSSTIYES